MFTFVQAKAIIQTLRSHAVNFGNKSRGGGGGSRNGTGDYGDGKQTNIATATNTDKGSHRHILCQQQRQHHIQ
jgi:hypothetical protein